VNTTQLLRCTGRTTRMIEAAIAAEAEGRAVYIATRSYSDRHLMERRLRAAGAPESIKVVSALEFDFGTMAVRGAHDNCRFFVDHAAIETCFARQLEELHRYDPPLKALCEAVRLADGSELPIAEAFRKGCLT